MPEPLLASEWPHGRPTRLFPTQVNRALRPEDGATIGTVLSARDGVVEIALRRDGTLRTLRVPFPERLADAIARPDLTRVDGRPLALVNVRMGVLGIAFGPAEPQPRLGWMFCCSTRDGEPVEVPGFDGHPSWALLPVAEVTDPGPA